MTYTEIIEEFKKQPPAIRTYIICELMKQQFISFTEVAKYHVKILEEQQEEDRSIKSELAACLMIETINQRERQTKEVKSILEKSIHRTIAILDKVGVFDLTSIKKHYNYDEKVGKSQGIYWKEEQS